MQVTSAAGRDAIARVAYAEAGNQGDSGLAAVVYTILNRLQDGRWGDTIDSVLNARAQFEPVLRAGGGLARAAGRLFGHPGAHRHHPEPGARRPAPGPDERRPLLPKSHDRHRPRPSW
jgi:hypothetical protein